MRHLIFWATVFGLAWLGMQPRPHAPPQRAPMWHCPDGETLSLQEHDVARTLWGPAVVAGCQFH